MRPLSSNQITISHKDKLDDISTLEEILNAISDCLESSADLAEYIAEIGRLTRKLKFKDSSPEYIRNKYGIFDRSHASTMRENGLEINYLEALENIAQIPETLEKFSSWHADLRILRQKILLILAAEKEPTTKSYEEVITEFSTLSKVDNFKKDVQNIYARKLSEKALEILKDSFLNSLNFENREDRYYFANILVKIGELSRELIDFTNPTKESGIFSFFKKVRNTLVHNPLAMIEANESDVRNLQILRNELMTDFAIMINNVVKSDRSYNIPKSTEDSLEQRKILLKSISFKEKKNKLLKLDKKKQKISNNLTRSINEIEYLKWVKDNPNIDPNKKNSIMEFGISKISHCLNTGIQSKDASLTTYIKDAQLFQKSWFEMTKARNEKIAHGVMNADDNHTYQEELAASVFAMSNDIKALFNIFYYNATVTEELFNIAASEFLDREYLVSIARNNIKIGNLDEAKNILIRIIQFYDADTYPIIISKTNSLLKQISAAASTSPAAKFLLGNNYFAKSLEEDFSQITIFTQRISQDFPEMEALRQAFSREKILSKSLASLTQDEKDITYLLLAPEYFSVKRKTLRLLVEICDNDNELAELLNQLAIMDEGIYGKVQKETLMIQGHLLTTQGKEKESEKKFSLAVQSNLGNKLNFVETLIHQSQSFAKQGKISKARKSLKEAESIANSAPIDNQVKIIALSEIVIFESSYGQNLEKSLIYLEKLHQFYDANKHKIRNDVGEIFIGIEQVMLMAEVFAIRGKYKPDPSPILVSENMSSQEISILNKAFERALRLQEFTEKGSREYDIAKIRIENLATSFEAIALSRDPSSSQNISLSSDLMEKAATLRKAYGFTQKCNSQTTSVKEMIEINFAIAEIVSNFQKDNISKRFREDVDKLYNKIINFNRICKDEAILNSSEWQNPVEIFSDMLTNIADPQNIKESFKFFSKSFAIKDLYNLPKERDFLFAMSHCQIMLGYEDGSSHTQEVITRLEQSKHAPQDGGIIQDVDIYNLLGDLYYKADNFREAIENYRFVLKNSTNEIQKAQAKAKAETSIAKHLANIRQEKPNNITLNDIKFKAIEEKLQTAYKNSKTDANYILLNKTSISAGDLNDYFAKKLKIEIPEIEKTSKRFKIKLDENLKNNLEQQLNKDKEISIV